MEALIIPYPAAREPGYICQGLYMENRKKILFITAAVLFFVDALILNQGGISAILMLLIIFWWLPKALLKKYKGLDSKLELTKAMVLGFAAGAVLLTNFANNKISQSRAE